MTFYGRIIGNIENRCALDSSVKITFNFDECVLLNFNVIKTIKSKIGFQFWALVSWEREPRYLYFVRRNADNVDHKSTVHFKYG